MAYDILKDDLIAIIQQSLDNAGIFYRCFGRIKSNSSLKAKLEDMTIKSDNKVSDYIGVRIVVYFEDDISILSTFFRSQFELVKEKIDVPGIEEFKPSRYNLTFLLPDYYLSIFNDRPSFITDSANPHFELQIRTIFSEGWHEVEHDFRYKRKSDWNEVSDHSRQLNSLFAVLQVTDKALINLFSSTAYDFYKRNHIENMIRHHLRIKIDSTIISAELLNVFNNNDNVIKQYYKLDRDIIVYNLLRNGNPIPLNINNIVLLLNHFCIHNEDINALTSETFLHELSRVNWVNTI